MDAKWDKFCHLPVTGPTSDDLESLFFLIHGRDPLEGHTGLFCLGDTRYMGNEKGLILIAELKKLWLTHAKNLEEHRLLKTAMLECHKNFTVSKI